MRHAPSGNSVGAYALSHFPTELQLEKYRSLERYGPYREPCSVAMSRVLRIIIVYDYP